MAIASNESMFTTIFWVSLVVTVVLGGMSTAGLLFWLRQRVYQHYLPYNRKQSYLYNFAEGRMNTGNVHCTLNGFALPGLMSGTSSAFLEIYVSATKVGEVFDPFIEIEALGIVGRQYLERGAREHVT